MMQLSRRAMFGGLVALAAPAIVRTPGLLMPVRPRCETYHFVTYEIGFKIKQETVHELTDADRAVFNRLLARSMRETQFNVMAEVLANA